MMIRTSTTMVSETITMMTPMVTVFRMTSTRMMTAMEHLMSTIQARLVSRRMTTSMAMGKKMARMAISTATISTTKTTRTWMAMVFQMKMMETWTPMELSMRKTMMTMPTAFPTKMKKMNPAGS